MNTESMQLTKEQWKIAENACVDGAVKLYYAFAEFASLPTE